MNNLSVYLPLSFEERILVAIDEIYQLRENDRIRRRLKAAKLRYPEASKEDINYESRGLDRSWMASILTLSFMKNATNIIIDGLCGIGKTYLSCVIAKEACINNVRAYTTRTNDLMDKYFEESRMGRKKSFMDKLERIELLVLDEWLVGPISEPEKTFLYELIERRYKKHSTIFVTQYPISSWHERLGGGSQVESMLDRICHNSIQFKQSKESNLREIYDAQLAKINYK